MTIIPRPTTLMCLLLTGIGVTALADTMSSTNFAINWDATDGGGGTLMSSNYTLTDSVAQATAVGSSASVNYVLASGFHTPPDDDSDGVKSFMDNCTFDPNPSQYDSNGDGYGNRCDPDLDNSGVVNFADYAPLASAFLSSPGSPNWNEDADFNGDGVVNFADIALFPVFFLGVPGPSGLVP